MPPSECQQSDQMLLMLRNVRKKNFHYHDVMWITIETKQFCTENLSTFQNYNYFNNSEAQTENARLDNPTFSFVEVKLLEKNE